MADLPRRLYALLAMSRPGFLLGILPVYLSGVALSRYQGHALRLHTAVLGLLLVWTVQAGTHYNNEYRDVETDAAAQTPSRIAGGSQVLVSGVVPPATARRTALVTFALSAALAVAIYVATTTGAGILLLAGAAITGGWFYSAPPAELVSRGGGAATVAVIVGGLVPATAYYLQTSTVSGALWLLWLPLVPLAFATSIATALPDRAADRRTGKRTLAVRLGRRRAGRLLLASVLTGWAFLAYSAVALDAGISGAVFVPALLLVGAVVRLTPEEGRDGADTAEAAALATVANLGWASLVLSALLWFASSPA